MKTVTLPLEEYNELLQNIQGLKNSNSTMFSKIEDAMHKKISWAEYGGGRIELAMKNHGRYSFWPIEYTYENYHKLKKGGLVE